MLKHVLTIQVYIEDATLSPLQMLLLKESINSLSTEISLIIVKLYINLGKHLV